MDFYKVLDQVIGLLQRHGRVTYRSLTRQFDLDNEYLEDIKEALLFTYPVIDESGRGLVWTGDTEDIQVTTTSQPDQAETQPTAQEEPLTQVTSPTPEQHIPDAERRQLTILFTDLVDSTKLSGQLDAEEYREIVRAYQAACAEVIERFDCHLAQTLGDGLLVYSGYPVAHENDAERAVRVGLGILESMTVLNERLDKDKGIRLGVRVGVHTGQVVVGNVGSGSRQEQLALGETPNIAARIQGLAEPDTVVISEATYRLVQGYFKCQELGEQALRGVADPIAVYRVLSESGVHSRLDVASTRGLTPLVGREQEVGLLLDRWSQVKDGSGQVVLLSGEGGIGKSRLVQALKDHVADEAHTRLECRSSPYFTNSALYPIIDMVQRTLRFQADDTPETKLDKLAQNLSQYRLPVKETVPLFATLLSIPMPEDRYSPLNLSPQWQRQKTLESIVAIMLEQAERQPLLFILDDAHWIDPTTLEWMDLLIDQIPTAQILTLITYRPEFQPTWGNRSYLSQITLNRLSQNQIERMAEQVAGAKRLPAEIVQQLVDKTDGVPLYVEEMTKSVLESGVLKEVNGQYELTGSISSLSIPATLQDSLMARLDRLVTAKAVAQYASVIGRQFSYELLQAVSQLDEATLQRELGRLVEAELVYQRGLPPQATYLFKHSLITDSAYQSLLRSTRQGYHRRIAEVLEEQFPETSENQPELLAHHYTEAGLHEKAIEYWQQAGQFAVERSANLEVVSHLTKGLALIVVLPDTPEHAHRELQMQTALGTACIVTKGLGAPEVARAYARARQLCRQVEDDPALFPVLVGLSRFYLARAEFQTARELGEQLLNLAQSAQDSTLQCGAYWTLWLPEFYGGDFSQVYARATQGLTLYNRQQHHAQVLLYGIDLKVVCLEWASLSAWYLGYTDRARTYQHEALTLAQELAHPYSFATALVFAAWLYQLCGEGSLTQERAEAAIALCTEQGFRFWLGIGQILRGWALTERPQGEPEALQILHQGMATWHSIGAVGRTGWLGLLAEAYSRQGQTETAKTVVDEALALSDNTGECFWKAELQRLKGEFGLQSGVQRHTSADLTPDAEAEACFHQAISIAQSQQAKSLELRAAISLTKLWQSQGKHKDAYALLAPVYNWFTEGHDTADLINAKALLGELEDQS